MRAGRASAHTHTARGSNRQDLWTWIRQTEADAGERDDCLTTGEREELAALRKENTQLKRASELLRTASDLFAAQLEPAQATALLDEHPHLGVEPVLRELHIPSSTYYRWRRAENEPCERRRQNAEPTEKIQRIHADSDGTYGSPREDGLADISPRRTGFTLRGPKTTLAPDLVQPNFTALAPSRPWVTDLTMIPTGEGPLWPSAIRDGFSRCVIAWETSARVDADLVLSSLEYALASREVEPGQLIHHTDHGCQCTSIKLTTRLLQKGIEWGPSRTWSSHDNALAENLWILV
ncbi:DDE-type integrase/transposase/recombinase [Streptomyces geranii]|uniref:DDE-type integrase/transposase/recombinase n=1 Tax=Streptomyces geranii TaxID=2058923 RepID=UPI0013003070|nr:DDE-type integrase/transposase/recombinase [Streptomyces geranii]